MKINKNLVVGAAGIGLAMFLNIPSVFAQATVLPTTDSSGDACTELLNKFETDGSLEAIRKNYGQKIEAARNDYVGAGGLGSSCTDDSDTCKDALAKQNEAGNTIQQNTTAQENANVNTLLGCAIKTGRISLQMLPVFVTYLANWILGMIGLVAVLMVMLGGYWYIFGGLMDQKEKGKKYIQNALAGMGLAILSWLIVTIVINALTG